MQLAVIRVGNQTKIRKIDALGEDVATAEDVKVPGHAISPYALEQHGTHVRLLRGGRVVGPVSVSTTACILPLGCIIGAKPEPIGFSLDVLDMTGAPFSVEQPLHMMGMTVHCIAALSHDQFLVGTDSHVMVLRVTLRTDIVRWSFWGAGTAVIERVRSCNMGGPVTSVAALPPPVFLAPDDGKTLRTKRVKTARLDVVPVATFAMGEATATMLTAHYAVALCGGRAEIFSRSDPADVRHVVLPVDVKPSAVAGDVVALVSSTATLLLNAVDGTWAWSRRTARIRDWDETYKRTAFIPSLGFSVTVTDPGIVCWHCVKVVPRCEPLIDSDSYVCAAEAVGVDLLYVAVAAQDEGTALTRVIAYKVSPDCTLACLGSFDTASRGAVTLAAGPDGALLVASTLYGNTNAF